MIVIIILSLLTNLFKSICCLVTQRKKYTSLAAFVLIVVIFEKAQMWNSQMTGLHKAQFGLSQGIAKIIIS